MQAEEQRGGGAPRYSIIPRTLVFLTRDNDVLLLQGAPTKRLWAGKYNGLGGHIEPGETPYQAAVRETREEAGLEAAQLELRALIHITLPEPPGIMLFVFVGTVPTGEPLPSEEGTPVWVSREAYTALPLVEDLPDLLPRVLSPGPCIFGEYHFTETGLVTTFDPE